VHARAVSAYAEILMHRRDAQKVLRKALRPEWPGFDETSGWAGDARGGGVNNAERAAIAEAVLGMEVNRLNLAWLVVDRARSAYEESLHAAGGIEAFGVDALGETLRGHADGSRAGKTFSAETELDANVLLPRARYVAAASAMLDLHWMRERVVSNEFHRDRLAVLRGGAKIQGDAWPDAADAKLAVAHSVPKWFAARLIEERGVEGAASLAAALSKKAPLTVRRNALKCDSNETLMRALAAEDVPARVSGWLKKETKQGAPDALSFDCGRPRLGIFGLETYRLGFFEVQDAGSQCIVSAVTQGLANTTRGARGETSTLKPLKVLDACCGNGGKTLALASSLSARESRNPGCLDAGYRIDCFDVDARRLRHLVAATRRAGCENVTRVVTKLDLRAVAAANVEANKYDAVLVDAPCSSAGALRRFPSLRWEMEEVKTRLDVWDDADLDERGSEDESSDRRISDSGRFYDDSEDFSDGRNFAIDGDVASASGRSDRTLTRSFPATQRRILRDAAALVRAGGVLVYATCSVLRSENEDVASWFEDAFAETFEPFAFPAGWPAADAENASSTTTTTTTHVVGLTPDAHGTDGFFIARWRRKR
jgi:16S rRNA C967 or C1407 C5-methylase (RsmB/RsmF family)